MLLHDASHRLLKTRRVILARQHGHAFGAARRAAEAHRGSPNCGACGARLAEAFWRCVACPGIYCTACEAGDKRLPHVSREAHAGGRALVRCRVPRALLAPADGEVAALALRLERLERLVKVYRADKTRYLTLAVAMSGSFSLYSFPGFSSLSQSALLSTASIFPAAGALAACITWKYVVCLAAAWWRLSIVALSGPASFDSSTFYVGVPPCGAAVGQIEHTVDPLASIAELCVNKPSAAACVPLCLPRGLALPEHSRRRMSGDVASTVASRTGGEDLGRGRHWLNA
ncbi:hypothetical protein FA95DRAFT_1609732 [Auriscalpium vulgare]|uniref:Uncharacterized protein n=1 Tax=Auriscalpium vulgare TaxID=40419 RepID=A0ACB8RH18_9AGAM|nr:hypothetical protein FA95DRAFT_1609732 [Auriscalpium vulgare]